MSVYKKGTITVECGPDMKNVFYQRLPFTNGLQINFDDEDDIIQIQYELDNQDIETLVSFLNKQDKKDFRLTCHSQDDQHKDKDYDLARDISKILAADDDGDDIMPSGKREGPVGNVGSIGKPLDDSKKNQGASNSKGLKSKSSSFYPPNDPRSNGGDDQAGRGPIGGYPGQKPTGGVVGGGMGMGMFYPGNTVKVNVDDFDQIFQDEDDSMNYPPQNRPMQGGMPGNMMMNSNMPRTGNPNMNPNFNPNMGAPSGMGGGMGPGPVRPNPAQMYPGQNMPANAPRFKGGPMTGGMGMNPNFQAQKVPGNQRLQPGGIQPMQNQDPNFYGAGFDDTQQQMPPVKAQKGNRGGKAVAQRGGYADYGNYAEDEGYGNMEYGGGNPASMGYQKPGRMANPQHAPYDQYQGDEYGEPAGYNDPMAGNMRGQPDMGPVRGGMAPMGGRGGQMAGRYPMNGGDYYEEDYEEPVNTMGRGQAGVQRGAHGAMGYDQEYDEYGDPVQGVYPPTQGGYHNDYQPHYGNALPHQPVAGGMAQQPGMGGMGAIVQEPFTVEGSINSQTFDRKPGFDRSRKKVHTRERLRANLQKNKQSDQKIPKKKSDGKGNGGGDDGDKMNERQGGNQEGAKEPKQENIDSDMEEGENNSRAFLEEEISSESNPKQNSQGSLEDHDDDDSDDGKKDK